MMSLIIIYAILAAFIVINVSANPFNFPGNYQGNFKPVGGCFSEAIGFPCCTQKNPKVYYIDHNGKWSIENGLWCGIRQSANCFSEYLGFPCCTQKNPKVYYQDFNGKWSIENNLWCGIPDQPEQAEQTTQIEQPEKTTQTEKTEKTTQTEQSEQTTQTEPEKTTQTENPEETKQPEQQQNYMSKLKISNTCPDKFRYKQDGVEYPEPKKITYYSKITETDRHMNIILPINYDKKKKYPVVYFLHGLMSNEDGMLTDESTIAVMTNLIKQKMAKEMIMVLPDIYAPLPGTAVEPDYNPEYYKGYDNFINELTEVIMPYMEKNYPILTGRENTAICGFSMGARTSLYIGYMKSELFGYVGAFAPAPGITPGEDSFSGKHPGLITEDEFRSKVPLIVSLIDCGTKDTVVGQFPKSYHEILTRNKQEHIWFEVPDADHDWNAISAGLYNFLQTTFDALNDQPEQPEETTTTEEPNVTEQPKETEQPDEPLLDEYMSKLKVSNTCPDEFRYKQDGVKYPEPKKITYYSKITETDRHMNIILPVNYDKKKKYPVVYFLHGLMSNEDGMLTDESTIAVMTNLIKKGMAKEMIMVLPDIYAPLPGTAVEPDYNPEYYKGYDNFINELTEVIMPYMEKNYPILTGRENTAICGFSMGARTSLYIGYMKSELFGYTGAFAPAPGITPGEDSFSGVHPGLITEDEFRAKVQPIVSLIDCGTNDTVVGQFPKSYHQILTRNKQKHIWFEVPGADHDWNAISAGLYNFLQTTFDALNDQPEQPEETTTPVETEQPDEPEETTTPVETEQPDEPEETELPDDSELFDEYMSKLKISNTCPKEFRYKQDGVKYPEPKKITYYSKITETDRHMNIVLPIGYDEKKKYPVVYFLHGLMSNEDGMLTDESTIAVMTNLIKQKMAKEMIMVLPDIYAPLPGTAVEPDYNPEYYKGYDNFINELTEVIMPYMEKNYPILTGRENTAICGFSMGARTSLYIGYMKSDLFGYVGSFAPAPGITPGEDSFSGVHPGLITEDEFRSEVPLIVSLIDCGTNDTVVGQFPNSYHKILTRNKQKHIWFEVPNADHDWNTISAGLYNFLQTTFDALNDQPDEPDVTEQPDEPEETELPDDSELYDEYMSKLKISNTCPKEFRYKQDGVKYPEPKKITYYSKITETDRHMNIVLPIGYDEKKKYPVVYFLHGLMSNEDGMLTDESTIAVMTNLIKQKMAKEMIMVLPDIYAPLPGTAVEPDYNPEYYKGYDNFINELTEVIMPYMEKNYPILTGRENTAICGFSMGARTSLYIGYMKSDLFGYVGSFAPAPGITPGEDSFSGVHPGLITEDEFRSEVPLIVSLIDCGTNDTVVGQFPNSYHKILTRNKQKHIWFEVPNADHDWNTISAGLYNFLQTTFDALNDQPDEPDVTEQPDEPEETELPDDSELYDEYMSKLKISNTCPKEFRYKQDGVKYPEPKKITYYSKITETDRHMNIVLPIGYDEKKKYPVVYFLHGLMSNEDGMLTDESTIAVMTNLIKQKMAKEMIMVLPDIYAPLPGTAVEPDYNPEYYKGYDNFINELTEVIMPYMEKNYPILTGRENTAICGFSMGARTSLYIGYMKSELFGYTGAFAPAPGITPGEDSFSGVHPGLITEDEFRAKVQPIVSLIDCGTKDTVVGQFPKSYHEILTRNKQKHIWFEVPDADHDWNAISAGLYNFLQTTFDALNDQPEQPEETTTANEPDVTEQPDEPEETELPDEPLLDEYMSKLKISNTCPKEFRYKQDGIKYPEPKKVTYYSKVTETDRHMNIILPVNYDEKKKYPVVYFLHGLMSNEDGMLTDESTIAVMTNLIKQKMAKEMIMVLPDIYAPLPGTAVEPDYNPEYYKGYDNFINELTEVIMPYMEKNYPILTGRENTAICGFSMGARTSLYIGYMKSELFGYTGAFAPAPGITPGEDSFSGVHPGLITEDEFRAKVQPIVSLIDCGTKDTVVGQFPKSYHEILTRNKQKHIWFEVPDADHDWNAISAGLYNFLQTTFDALNDQPEQPEETTTANEPDVTEQPDEPEETELPDEPLLDEYMSKLKISNTCPKEFRYKQDGIKYPEPKKVTYYSKVTETDRHMNIILPVNYDKKKKYPVVYFLHGLMSNEDGMLTDESTIAVMTNLIKQKMAKEMIMVLPDIYAPLPGTAVEPDYNPEYYKGYDNFINELTEVIMPYMEKNYPILTGRENTAICGFSMGARTSLYIGYMKSELFGYTGAFAPAPGITPGEDSFSGVHPGLITEDEFRAKVQPIVSLIDCGTKDTVVGQFPKSYHEILTRNKQKHIWFEVPDADHDWNAISAGLYNFLQTTFDALNDQPEQPEETTTANEPDVTEQPDEPEETEQPDEPLLDEYMSKLKISNTCPKEFRYKQDGIKYPEPKKVTYYSKVTETDRHMNIILPVNYDKKKKYPVVYFLHGLMSNEDGMLTDESTIAVMTNLIKQKMAKEMIMVLPDIYAPLPGTAVEPDYNPEYYKGYDNFINELTEVIMPYMEKNYPILTGRENTAICGFSMGARTSLYIGYMKSELFGYTGAFAPAPGITPGEDSFSGVHPGLITEDEFRAKVQPIVSLIDCGTKDTVVGQFPKSYHEILTRNKQKHIWFEVPGADHDWNAISAGLYNFLQTTFDALNDQPEQPEETTTANEPDVTEQPDEPEETELPDEPLLDEYMSKLKITNTCPKEFRYKQDGIKYPEPKKVTYYSKVTETDRHMNIILPVNYDKKKKYPVVYFLHGLMSNEDGMLTDESTIAVMTNLIKQKMAKEMIMVLPDIYAPLPGTAVEPDYNPEYYKGYDNFINELTEVIMPYMEKNYPILTGRENTAICGFSMGARTSLYIGYMKSELFGYTGAFAPAPGITPGEDSFSGVHPGLITEDEFRAKVQPIVSLIDCGTKDTVVGQFPKSYHEILTRNKQKHIWFEVPDADHDWNAISAGLYNFLQTTFDALNDQPEQPEETTTANEPDVTEQPDEPEETEQPDEPLLDEYMSKLKISNTCPDKFRYKQDGVKYPEPKKVTYYSKITETDRHMNIILPVNYDEKKKYPVVYFLHGLMSNEDGMLTDESTIAVMTNLIKQKMAKEMIMVLPDIYAPLPGTAVEPDYNPEYYKGYDNFINELTEVIMPYMEKNYPILTGRENTAICGFSMGARTSLYIGYMKSELFGYTGAFAPAPGITPGEDSFSGVHPGLITEDEFRAKVQPIVSLIDCGTKDTVVGQFPKSYHEILTRNKQKHIWFEVPDADHDWNAISAGLYNFLQTTFDALNDQPEQPEETTTANEPDVTEQPDEPEETEQPNEPLLDEYMSKLKISNTCPDKFRYKQDGVKYPEPKKVTYYSKITETDRHMNIILPVNYDKKKKYPVVYFLHGLMSNEDGMLTDESTIAVMTNLIKQKMAKEMIMVLPDIYAPLPGTAVEPDYNPEYYKGYDNFINELTEVIMPYMEKNYPILTGRENTAICGFSMGARTSLYIGYMKSELFGYTGAFAPAPGITPGEDSFSGVHPGLITEDEFRAKVQPIVSLIDCGTKDTVVGQFPKSYHEILTRNKQKHIWFEVPDADHDWNAISAGLYNFLQTTFGALNE